MSDVDQIVSEAERAQAEAEAAARRAADLEARADEARRQVAVEREARQQDWARRVIDAYDTELGAADRALQEAVTRFDAAAEDPAAAATAYLAWAEAATRHYTVQVRAATVAPVIGMEATKAESIPPPPFSQALDAALDRRVAARAAQIRDETAAEIAAHLDDGAADGSAAPERVAPTAGTNDAPTLN